MCGQAEEGRERCAECRLVLLHPDPKGPVDYSHSATLFVEQSQARIEKITKTATRNMYLYQTGLVASRSYC